MCCCFFFYFVFFPCEYLKPHPKCQVVVFSPNNKRNSPVLFLKCSSHMNEMLLWKFSFNCTHLIFFLDDSFGKKIFFLLRSKRKTCPILFLSQIVAMILLYLQAAQTESKENSLAQSSSSFLKYEFHFWSGLWPICFCLCLLDDQGFLHACCDSSAFEKPSIMSQTAHWNMSCAQKFCSSFPGMEPLQFILASC